MPLHIQLMGNEDNFHFLGNRVFQHLVALNLLELLSGDVVVRGSNLPHFFEPNTLTDDLPPGQVVKVDKHKIDFLEIVARYKSGEIQGVDITSCGMRLEQFQHLRPFVVSYFDELLGDITLPETCKSRLLINVRLGDVGADTAIHPDYYPLPLSYYKKLTKNLPTPPIFLGQFSDDYYTNELAKAFPDAEFFNLGVLESFKMIREFESSVLSVSSFSWMAGWSSSSNKSLKMPVAGLFNPLQRPDVNLVASDDQRFEFEHFPQIARLAGENLREFLARFERKYSVSGSNNSSRVE